MVHKMGDRDQETPKGNTKTKTHDGQGREGGALPPHLSGRDPTQPVADTRVFGGR